MAFLPAELARRTAQMGFFRRTPAFEEAVAERVAVARRQPFCRPADYARSRAKTSKIWIEVQKRLEQADELPPVTAATKAFVASGVQGDVERFRVRLSTDVGPGTPAATLSALAEDGSAKVEVVLEGAEPTLIYTVPVLLAQPDFRELRC